MNESNPNVKKPTNRDVAKLAGVSVATVSYVINGRTDQHISEATQKKVWQAINFLNYSPNPYAVALNTEQPRTVVIRSSVDATELTEREILRFMHSLNPLCEDKHVVLNYSLDKRAAKLAATACICFDMPREEFHRLADENFIPIVAVHSLIDDPVFYQINTDFDRVRREAQAALGEHFTYVCVRPNNAETAEQIRAAFDNVAFIDTAADVNALTCTNVALSQPSLFDLFGSDRFRVYRYTACAEHRAAAAMDCIAKALNRLTVTDQEHFIKL